MKNNTNRLRIISLCISPLAFIVANQAFAQAPAGVGTSSQPSDLSAQSQDDSANAGLAPGDIVVTAQRRGESLQRVPISISAYTQKTLDRQGVRDVQDIVRLTPGMNFSRGGQQGLTSISIRGIVSNGGASTTGIYLDDVPIQARRLGFSGGSPFLETFDLDRVEVLRGPQGTLFGAGSQGGTVRFITPQPSLDKFSAYGRAEISTTRYGGQNYEIGAAVGGPIVQDKIGFRASGWYRDTSGWVDRIDPRTGVRQAEDTNSGNTLTGKLAFTLAPSETIKITPSIFYQRQISHDVSTYWTILSDPEKGQFRSGNEFASPSRDEFYIPSLNVSLDISDAISLISVTSYLNRDQVIESDYTQLSRAIIFGNPIPPAGALGKNVFSNSQRNFTQELRLQSNAAGQRFRWIVGGFYQNAKQSSTQLARDPTLATEFLNTVGFPFALAFGQDPIDGEIIYRQDPYNGVDEQLAGFGQADFDILENLTVTAGVRVAHTKFNFNTTIGGPFAGPTFSDSGEQSATPVTPKFGVEYRMSPTSSIYASASKGFRVGGSNPRQYSICQPQLNALGLAGINPTTYGPDTVWSYEAGTKNQLFNRRVTINASIFYIDWKNIQQFVTLNSCGGGFIANLGKAVSKGFDLQASVIPVDGLTLGAAVGYTHGEFKDTFYAGAAIPGTSAVTKGDRIQGSPWRIALNAEYRGDIGADRTVYARVDYQYSSQEPSNVAQNNVANGLNFIPQYYGSARTHYVTARLGVELGRVDVSLFADNLLDSSKALERQNYVNTSLTRESSFRPRTIGLTGTYRY